MSQLDDVSQRRLDKAKKYLRLLLQDTPALNRLILKEESDDELLTFAIDMCLSDWNTTSPILPPYHIGTFPSLYLLMMGSAIQIMRTQGILQSRNELNYSAGGSSFVRSNKTNYYMTWMTNMAADYEQKKRAFKVQRNITRGWGGAHSDYNLIGFSW